MRRVLAGALALILLALIVVAGIAWLGLRGDQAVAGTVPRLAADRVGDPVDRGAYLVTAGNCRGCHTDRGGPPFAGGRAMPTPFGTFYAPNLTPDAETGIGRWTDDDFWHALHEGRRPDGAPLYPAFPYTHYTQLSREDSDAMLGYLRSLAPVRRVNRSHALRFPYNQRWLLVAWRALFFRPGGFERDPAHDERWNRGAYLVQGLGHCGACHSSRNALGAIRSRDHAAGGVVLNWYAPSLFSAAEAGVADWSEAQIVSLLRDGVAGNASAMGPMAEVVYESLQHLDEIDLDAMAAYLRSLPQQPAASVTHDYALTTAELERSVDSGAQLYRKHCADCHGEAGQGRAPAAPALAGNRAVLMPQPGNAIRVLLYGGYAPSTAGNPEPFGMPPYAARLNDQQVADVLNFTRRAWMQKATPVFDYEVARERTGPLW